MPIRKTMNVSVTPELERSASEVVRAALRLLDKEEPLDLVNLSSRNGEIDAHVGPAQ